jgi:predicted transcriptional regulator
MKIEQLTKSLRMVNTEYELDWTDVLVLGEVLRLMDKGEVTIMEILALEGIASPATIHVRLRKLCDKQLLTKSERESNNRYKVLTKGPKLDRLLTKLEKV